MADARGRTVDSFRRSVSRPRPVVSVPEVSVQFRAAALALASIVIVSTAVFAADTPRKAHPHFNSGGVLNWTTTLADAQALAKAEDKLIFIEYGREA